MIIASLITLGQLMNHSSFLTRLPVDSIGGSSGNSIESATPVVVGGGEPLELLLDRLADLMLDGDLLVSRAASLLLNRFRQLEEQRSIESSIYKKRFACYNGKWLLAIRASRAELTGGGGEKPAYCKTGAMIDAPADNLLADQYDYDDDDELEEDGEDYGADDAELNHLRAFGDESTVANGPAGIGGVAGGRLDGESQDEQEEDDDGAELETPDLNVIDANSMIKHLTSRREFRSEWLRPSGGVGDK